MTTLLDQLIAARALDAERLAPDNVEADVEEAVAATWGSAITIVEDWQALRDFGGVATALLDAVEALLTHGDAPSAQVFPHVARLREAYNAVVDEANR